MVRLSNYKSAIVILVLLLCGCAKQIPLPAQTDAHQKYEQGDFEEALAALDKQPVRNKDRLLYLLDKGTFLHAAGKYEESNKVFEEAAHFAEYWRSKSAGQEIAAAFTNERVLTYAGATYERLLIQVFQMLNYALLGQSEEALVEVRQYHNDLARFFGSQIPKEYQDAFAYDLASILWNLNGHTDDARIDFQKASKTNSNASKIDTEGNVVVILESGKAPILEGEKTWIADIKIELPKIRERESQTDHAQIVVDYATKATTTTLNNITTMAKADLEHKLEVAKTHKFFKTALKEWVEAKTFYTLNKTDLPLGAKLAEEIFVTAAVSMLFNSLEAADTRIWSTLPNTFQLARFSLPEGEHELKIWRIDSQGNKIGKPISKKIIVQKNRPTFAVFRIF